MPIQCQRLHITFAVFPFLLCFAVTAHVNQPKSDGQCHHGSPSTSASIVLVVSFLSETYQNPHLRAISAATDHNSGPLGVNLDATSRRHCLNFCRASRPGTRPSDPTYTLPSTPAYVHWSLDEMRFLGTSGKMRYDVITIGSPSSGVGGSQVSDGTWGHTCHLGFYRHKITAGRIELCKCHKIADI